MKAFRVVGKFKMGLTKTPFSIETIGKDPADAQDRVLSIIGSRHRVNRFQIEISKVEGIQPDKATDISIPKRIALVK